MHDLVQRPPARFADRGQRTISGIADTEWVRHLVVVGDAQDGAGFILIPLRLTRSAYQQAVGLSNVFFGETALAAGFIDEMDLPEAVLSRAEEAARFCLDYPALARVMFSRPFQDFDPGPEELAASPSVRETFVSRIKRCTDAGLLIGDPGDIAHVLLALAQGLAVQEGGRWLGKSKASVNRRWEVGVTGILRGFSR
jgi:hypothetical protein